jgi:hypothetical protein
MKRFFGSLRRAARLCLPVAVLGALGGRGALATSPGSQGTEWPETTSAPEEAALSDAMPGESTSTEAFRAGGRDSLSRSMPRDASGFDPSVTRLQAPKGWKEDGAVTNAHVAKVAPGPDDQVYGRMKRAGSVKVGDLLYVLRRDVATEADADPQALYLERIGVVRAEAVLPKRRVRLRVLKASSEVAPTDLLSRVPL